MVVSGPRITVLLLLLLLLLLTGSLVAAALISSPAAAAAAALVAEGIPLLSFGWKGLMLLEILLILLIDVCGIIHSPWWLWLVPWLLCCTGCLQCVADVLHCDSLNVCVVFVYLCSHRNTPKVTRVQT